MWWGYGAKGLSLATPFKCRTFSSWRCSPAASVEPGRLCEGRAPWLLFASSSPWDVLLDYFSSSYSLGLRVGWWCGEALRLWSRSRSGSFPFHPQRRVGAELAAARWGVGGVTYQIRRWRAKGERDGDDLEKKTDWISLRHLLLVLLVGLAAAAAAAASSSCSCSSWASPPLPPHFERERERRRSLWLTAVWWVVIAVWQVGGGGRTQVEGVRWKATEEVEIDESEASPNKIRRVKQHLWFCGLGHPLWDVISSYSTLRFYRTYLSVSSIGDRDSFV